MGESAESATPRLAAPLRAELDSRVLACLYQARLKSDHAPALAGLLFGSERGGTADITAAAVVGPVAELRDLIETDRLEAFVRHFERVYNAALIGWFCEGQEGFEWLHYRVSQLRSGTFLFLWADWHDEASGFALTVLAPAANPLLRQDFCTFLPICHRVATRPLPSPELWALLLASQPPQLSAEDVRPLLRSAKLSPQSADQRKLLETRLAEWERQLDAAEAVLAETATLRAQF